VRGRVGPQGVKQEVRGNKVAGRRLVVWGGRYLHTLTNLANRTISAARQARAFFFTHKQKRQAGGGGQAATGAETRVKSRSSRVRRLVGQRDVEFRLFFALFVLYVRGFAL